MNTAVEFLYERLERMIPRTALYDIDKESYFEQAKEMEKEQIIDARVNGVCEGIDIGGNPITEDISKNHENYYKEKFNK